MSIFGKTINSAPPPDENLHQWNTVKASSFADPADIRAFQRCKARGYSDQFCFTQGDNGIGRWGHDCSDEDALYVALPREVWMDAGKSGGAAVVLRYNGKTVHAQLGDTMPRLANIENGAGIDLNPGAAKALGLKPPFLIDGVQWRWA